MKKLDLGIGMVMGATLMGLYNNMVPEKTKKQMKNAVNDMAKDVNLK